MIKASTHLAWNDGVFHHSLESYNHCPGISQPTFYRNGHQLRSPPFHACLFWKQHMPAILGKHSSYLQPRVFYEFAKAGKVKGGRSLGSCCSYSLPLELSASSSIKMMAGNEGEEIKSFYASEAHLLLPMSHPSSSLLTWVNTDAQAKRSTCQQPVKKEGKDS